MVFVVAPLTLEYLPTKQATQLVDDELVEYFPASHGIQYISETDSHNVRCLRFRGHWPILIRVGLSDVLRVVQWRAAGDQNRRRGRAGGDRLQSGAASDVVQGQQWLQWRDPRACERDDIVYWYLIQ